MEDIYGLVKTVLISDSGEANSGYKYDIYRIEGDKSDFWHVIPAMQEKKSNDKDSRNVWLILASKDFTGSHELEDIINECRVHYRENHPLKV